MFEQIKSISVFEVYIDIKTSYKQKKSLLIKQTKT